jgi:hypothetical protein
MSCMWTPSRGKLSAPCCDLRCVEAAGTGDAGCEEVALSRVGRWNAVDWKDRLLRNGCGDGCESIDVSDAGTRMRLGAPQSFCGSTHQLHFQSHRLA